MPLKPLEERPDDVYPAPPFKPFRRGRDAGEDA